MRQGVNFFVTVLIFFAAWKLFPKYVIADSVGDIAIAVLMYYAISTFLVVMVAFAVVFFRIDNFWLIMALLLATGIFTGFIVLSAVSYLLVGFEVVGFWPKMLLALCTSVRKISVKLTMD